MSRDNEKTNEKLERARKVNIKVENKREINPYYLKVSKRYRTLKFVVLTLLVIYLVGMLTMFRSQITYENLVYLMKDLDTDIDASGALFREIKYDESQKMSAAIYKGRFAAATTSTFMLYNTTGSAERQYQISMENPKVLSGDKYVMVYDVGGSSYSLYTTIVGVLSKQTEYTLQGAALSRSGSFALITRARENRYLVSIFDENFKEVSKIYKDKYVMDVALSDDGTRYALVSCDITGSDITTEVMYGSVKSENASTTEIAGTMPLDVAFFSDGSFCVVGDDSVSFFPKDGGQPVRRSLEGYGIISASFSSDHAMLLESDNIVDSKNTLIVYSSSGDETLRHSENAKIASSALGESAAFYTHDGKLTKISFDGTLEETTCPLTVSGLVAYSDNVLVLEATRAESGFTPDDSAAETGKE